MTLPPQVEKAVQNIDKYMAKYPSLTQYERFKELELKTGQPKALFFVGTVLLLFAVLSFLGGGKLIFNLVGFIYPAYMSFKSMDSTANANEITQWLTYWVVFSFVNIFENLFAFVTTLIPFYFWIKCAFIVWMWYPQTRGAQTVYDQGLRPLLAPYLKTDNKAE